MVLQIINTIGIWILLGTLVDDAIERSLDNKSEDFSSESNTNCATSISLTFKIFNFSVPWICQLETVFDDMLHSFLAGFLTLYV